MKFSRANLLILAMKLLGKLPLPVAQWIGRQLGNISSLLPTQARAVTATNLQMCLPELPPEKRRKMVRRSLQHTAQMAMEIPLMWEWPVDRCLNLIREVRGLDLLEQAREGDDGLILLAPHLGNWELTGLYFSSRYRMASLYSPPHLAGFEEYMSRVRGRSGAELVRGDRRGLSRMIKLLREGGVAGILPDQSPVKSGGVFAPFFGIEVRTMTLASKLAQKSGARLLITYAERLPKSEGFRLVIRHCEPGLDNPDPVIAATALNLSVEKCVRAIPEQYQWEYKRLRHRPAGFPNPYKKR